MLLLTINMTDKLQFSDSLYFSEIEKNWNLNLISSVYLNSSCENSNQLLIQKQWPNLSIDCYRDAYIIPKFCGRKFFYYDYFGEISYFNSYIANEAFPIGFWRGEILCRKIEENFQNKTYFDLNIKRNSADCPLYTHSHGIIDSNGNHLCVDNDSNNINNKNNDLPLNFLKFFDLNEFENFKNTTSAESNKDFFSIKLPASGSWVVFSNNINNNNNQNNKNVEEIKIPVDFKISNEQPCLNPYYKNV